MDRRLSSLDSVFLSIAERLLARFVEAGIPVLIVNTRRTAVEQAELVAKGASWVTHSKHQDGLAIDVAPYETFALHGADKLNWNCSDEVWRRMAEIGESLGLTCGYRWTQRDCGHFEYKPVEGSKNGLLV